MRRTNLKSEAGFTLVETLMAVSLIVIVLTSIMPLYIGLTRYVTSNRQKAEASALAAQEMERIRGAVYADVGVAGSNPSGIFTPDRDETGPNGGRFHIAVRIWWVDDPMDGTAATGADQLPNDYKQARVTVTKPGNTETLAQLTSNIARESEEPPSIGGNVIVKTFLADGVTAVPDVRVNITTGPSSPLTNWTNDEGVSLFAELTPSVTSGDYSISVEKTGFVVRIDQEIQTTTVALGQTRTVTFIIDQPGQLTVRLLDSSGAQIQTQSALTISNAEIGDIRYDGPSGYFNITTLLPGDYELTAYAAGFSATPTPISSTVVRGQTTYVDINLQPMPIGHLSLHVYDALTRQKLGITEVKLTNDSTGEVINTQTSASGDLGINLEVAVYSIAVTASGYIPHYADVTITEDNTTTLDAYLEGYPTTGLVMVRAETRSHTPRSGVEVRVVGPGYDEQGITGSSGEVVFSNLIPGDYTVYRWGGRGWRYPRSVSVTAGNQETVVYSF
jgi:type II secretory pathway pseudopilin PulG